MDVCEAKTESEVSPDQPIVSEHVQFEVALQNCVNLLEFCKSNKLQLIKPDSLLDMTGAHCRLPPELEPTLRELCNTVKAYIRSFFYANSQEKVFFCVLWLCTSYRIHCLRRLLEHVYL